MGFRCVTVTIPSIFLLVKGFMMSYVSCSYSYTVWGEFSVNNTLDHLASHFVCVIPSKVYIDHLRKHLAFPSFFWTSMCTINLEKPVHSVVRPPALDLETFYSLLQMDGAAYDGVEYMARSYVPLPKNHS